MAFHSLTGTIETFALSLPAKANAFSGASRSGAFALELPVKEISFHGTNGVVGNFAWTLPDKIFALHGLVGTKASFALELPMKEFLFTGNSGLTITLPMKEILFTGKTGERAGFAFTMPMATAVFAGHESVSGNFAISLPVPQLLLHGLTGTKSSFALSAPVLQGLFTGKTGERGSFALELPIFTNVFHSRSNVTGSLVLTLPLIQLFLEGHNTPANHYRAWVMNLRNKALSEYTNFGFNSFAVIGNTVLAASADGVFVLGTQATDNGTAIDGSFTTAISDFDSGFIKRVPRLYVDGATDGDLLFSTILTETRDRAAPADKATRTYRLVNNSMSSHQQRRVPIGKGPKSRFWQFGVANENGSDFSLTSLMAYPVKLPRRISG